MRVEPIEKNEVSCRNCDNFKGSTSCWQSANECGEGLPKYKKKEKNNV